MKEKIKVILLYSIAIALLMFLITYTIRTLIDYGCSSFMFFSTSKEAKTNTEYLATKIIFWC